MVWKKISSRHSRFLSSFWNNRWFDVMPSNLTNVSVHVSFISLRDASWGFFCPWVWKCSNELFFKLENKLVATSIGNYRTILAAIIINVWFFSSGAIPRWKIIYEVKLTTKKKKGLAYFRYLFYPITRGGFYRDKFPTLF